MLLYDWLDRNGDIEKDCDSQDMPLSLVVQVEARVPSEVTLQSLEITVFLVGHLLVSRGVTLCREVASRESCTVERQCLPLCHP